MKWSKCLVVECKWESSTGSTDQKYPYFVSSANINPQPVIFVMDGDGYSRLSGKWLKSQAGEGRILHVMNQGELARFASQGNL